MTNLLAIINVTKWDASIISALIGAIVSLLVFQVTKKYNTKKEKNEVISEIISYLLNQKVYSKRYVGHKVWLNYYNMMYLMSERSVNLDLINEKIENRLKFIEEIELKLIESGTYLTTLSSKYKTFFPKDKYFIQTFNSIKGFCISDNVKTTRFDNLNISKVTGQEVYEFIHSEINKSNIELESSLFLTIDNLIKHIELKIKYTSLH